MLFSLLRSCFDRLSTNGQLPMVPTLNPFTLSLSKGEGGVFPQLVSFAAADRSPATPSVPRRRDRRAHLSLGKLSRRATAARLPARVQVRACRLRRGSRRWC